MKLDEIMKLIDAGYTKADIDALTSADQPDQPAAQAQQANDQPADQPDQQAQQAQQAADQPAVQTQQAQPAADPILDALNKLTETIIKSNINHTVTQPAERTPEQALAEIIAPPKPEKRR